MNFIIVIVFTFLSSFLFSQKNLTGESDILVSAAYPELSENSADLFHKGKYIIKIVSDGDKVFIQKNDRKTLKMISKTETILPDKSDYEGAFNLQNNFFILYSLWDKEGKKEQLICREIDVDKGIFLNNDRVIVTLNSKLISGTQQELGQYKMKVTNKFDVLVFNSGKNLLVKCRLKPKEKNDFKNKAVFGLFSFDENLQLNYGNEYEMPEVEGLTTNKDYCIDKKGAIFSLEYCPSEIYDKSDGGRMGYHLYSYNKDKSISVKRLKLTNMSISNLRFCESDVDKLHVFGSYELSNSSGGENGLFFLRFDDNNQSFESFTARISNNIVNQNVGKTILESNQSSLKEGKEIGIQHLTSLNSYVNDKGDVSMLFEIQYYNETTLRSGNKSRTIRTYHHDDFVLAKFNQNGKLLWNKKLPKRQVSYNPIYNKHILVKGHHLLFYNENVKNLNIDSLVIPENHDEGYGGYLASYSINDTTGIVGKKFYFDSKNLKKNEIVDFSPSKIIFIEPNEIYAEGRKKMLKTIMFRINLK